MKNKNFYKKKHKVTKRMELETHDRGKWPRYDELIITTNSKVNKVRQLLGIPVDTVLYLRAFLMISLRG